MMGWIFTITHRKIIDWYRKKRLPQTDLKGYNDTDDPSQESLISDSGIDIEKDFIKNMVFVALEQAIEELPENQQKIIILQTIQGKTFKEIAAETKVPVNTLVARKRYALRFLQIKTRPKIFIN